MQAPRQAVLRVQYNRVEISNDLAGSLLEFTYRDAPSGELDDLTIRLEDSKQLWQGAWSPEEGDTIEAAIETRNWNAPGEVQQLPCGTFSVDSGGCYGPPDTVTIKAVSIPASSPVRQEKHTRAWESITLWALAQQVAESAGLELHYYATDNPSYDRRDQTDQTDLGFLVEAAKNEGIATKITGGWLILFDEEFYENQDAVLTITRGNDNVLAFGFEWNTIQAAYRACELRYTSPKDNTTIQVTYTPPNAPAEGPVLRIEEQVDSEAEALRVARKRLREKNKQAGKASFTLAGDVRLATGITLNVSGWGKFDGKYLVENAVHRVGNNGYTTELDIRKVLRW